MALETKQTAIRKAALPHIALWCLYYGAAMLFATYFAFFDLPISSASFDGFKTATHVSLLGFAFLSSIFIKEKYIDLTAKIANAVLVVLLLCYTIFDILKANAIFGVALGLPFGVLCNQLLKMFCYKFNNREKFVAIVMANLGLCILGIVTSFIMRGSLAFNIIITIFMVACFVVQFFVKNIQDEPFESLKGVKNNNLILVTIFGAMGGLLSTGSVILMGNLNVISIGTDFMYLFFIGGILGCIAFFLLIKTNYWIVMSFNLAFALTIVSVGAISFVDVYAMKIVLQILLGSAFTSGMLCVYYIIGVIAKEYDKKLFLPIITGGIGIIGGVGAPLVVMVAVRYLDYTIDTIFLCVAAIMMIIMLMLSPVLFKHIFERKETALEATANQTKLDNFKLSEREKEVATLLLKGLTMRQIAGELKVSPATVNTHTTSIYRKCKINSKAEFFFLMSNK